MQKKYIVRLPDEERLELQEVVKKLKGSNQKVRRVQVLLKADAAEALQCCLHRESLDRRCGKVF